MKDFFNLDEIVFEEDELEMLVFEDEKSNMEKENIVFSGFRDKELEKKMEKKGHIISKDITKKITLLVVKDLDSSTSKTEKAKSYGIRIMSLEEFQSKY